MVSTGSLRRLWFNVHMWVGVALFLVLVPLSVSGSYLLWKDEIDAWTHPARAPATAGAPALAASAYLDAAQQALGERARVSQLRMPDHAGAPIVVVGVVGRADGEARNGDRPRGDGAGRGRGEGGDGARRAPAQAGDGRAGAAPEGAAAPRGRMRTLTAWLDPVSGRVLDIADTNASFSQWVHRLHGSLTLPENGRKVVGWLGWAMFVSSLTGLWLWWPRNGRLLMGLRWTRSASTLTNLHYLTGFWICIPLAVLSLTGALISFPQSFRAAVSAVAPVGPQQQGGGGGGGQNGGAPMRHTTLSPDEAVRLALSQGADSKLRSLALPSRGRPVWRVQIERNGAPADLTVDDETSVVAAVTQAKRAAGDEIVRQNRRIHSGDEGGLLWKLIITLAGLAPAILGVTGVIVWARRQLRKLAAQPKFAPAE